MSNLASKLTLVAAIVAGASVGFAPSATAGEGGLAASAGFDLEATTGDNPVDAASVAAAAGKVGAYAGATADIITQQNEEDGTRAFAAGSGSQINVQSNSILVDNLKGGGSSSAQLGQAQANNMTGQTIDVDATEGTIDAASQ